MDCKPSELKKGDRVIFIFNTMDTMHGFYLGTDEFMGESWLGIEADGLTYSGPAWYPLRSIRNIAFCDKKYFEVMQKVSKYERKRRMKDLKSKLAVHESRIIHRPEGYDGNIQLPQDKMEIQ